MADPAGPAGIARFLERSLKAEETYEAALAATPGLSSRTTSSRSSRRGAGRRKDGATT